MEISKIQFEQLLNSGKISESFEELDVNSDNIINEKDLQVAPNSEIKNFIQNVLNFANTEQEPELDTENFDLELNAILSDDNNTNSVSNTTADNTTSTVDSSTTTTQETQPINQVETQTINQNGIEITIPKNIPVSASDFIQIDDNGNISVFFAKGRKLLQKTFDTNGVLVSTSEITGRKFTYDKATKNKTGISGENYSIKTTDAAGNITEEKYNKGKISSKKITSSDGSRVEAFSYSNGKEKSHTVTTKTKDSSGGLTTVIDSYDADGFKFKSKSTQSVKTSKLFTSTISSSTTYYDKVTGYKTIQEKGLIRTYMADGTLICEINNSSSKCVSGLDQIAYFGTTTYPNKQAISDNYLNNLKNYTIGSGEPLISAKSLANCVPADAVYEIGPNGLFKQINQDEGNTIKKNENAVIYVHTINNKKVYTLRTRDGFNSDPSFYSFTEDDIQTLLNETIGKGLFSKGTRASITSAIKQTSIQQKLIRETVNGVSKQSCCFDYAALGPRENVYVNSLGIVSKDCSTKGCCITGRSENYAIEGLLKILNNQGADTDAFRKEALKEYAIQKGADSSIVASMSLEGLENLVKEERLLYKDSLSKAQPLFDFAYGSYAYKKQQKIHEDAADLWRNFYKNLNMNSAKLEYENEVEKLDELKAAQANKTASDTTDYDLEIQKQQAKVDEAKKYFESNS